jgi:hypothetical protein
MSYWVVAIGCGGGLSGNAAEPLRVPRALAARGTGFALWQRILKRKPSVEVMLAGSVETAVAGAADLCQDGPAITKRYEHHLVLDRIRQSLARRASAKPKL